MLLAYKTCSLIADRPKVETEFLCQELSWGRRKSFGQKKSVHERLI